MLEAIAPLVSVAQASDKVLHAACFPISAMGFSKAVPLAESGERVASGTPGLDGGEQEWILPPDATPEPWNTFPLIIYSLCSGLLSVEVDASRSEELKGLYQRLRDDLASLDGWMIPIKGEL